MRALSFSHGLSHGVIELRRHLVKSDMTFRRTTQWRPGAGNSQSQFEAALTPVAGPLSISLSINALSLARGRATTRRTPLSCTFIARHREHMYEGALRMATHFKANSDFCNCRPRDQLQKCKIVASVWPTSRCSKLSPGSELTRGSSFATWLTRKRCAL